MLFSSAEFLFGFLPIVVVCFYSLSVSGCSRWLLPFVVAASFVFYAWWNPRDIGIFAGSIAWNYGLGRLICRYERWSRALLFFGVATNLAVLGWFKYRVFILRDILRLEALPPSILSDLPIGISFFTFQQIAWLIDTRRNREIEASPLQYAGFVSFFPQLIAGPIVNHRQLVPQLQGPSLRQIHPLLIAAGVSLFAIGLFKKIGVADSLAAPVNLAFSAAEQGRLIACVAAWTGVLSYAGQIYFDFSGYSDMALGLGLIFGIRLPANFLSPYRAADISEFWRRWHITLSHFLRDFVYIPLGGNRCGRGRQCINLIVTMVLGGLWHGAGFTFLVWGLMHGLLLVGLEAWRAIGKAARASNLWWPTVPRPCGVLGTFVLVCLAWVPFRATSLEGASRMYCSLMPAGMNDSGSGLSPESPDVLARPTPYGMGKKQLLWVASVLGACFLLPSSMQVFRSPLRGRWDKSPAFRGASCSWRPSIGWAFVTAAGLVYGALQSLSVAPTPFLYFQF